jgi:hypothetical protein
MIRRTALLSAGLVFLSACHSAAAAPGASPPPPPTAAATRAFPYAIVEQTKYEGEKTYTCAADACWRDDGGLTGAPETFYPELDADTPAVRALLAAIGLPRDAAADDAERWRRIGAVWEWMARETVFSNELDGAEPWAALMELSATPTGQWPTIAEMAAVWERYGKLPLGACHSKAFTFVTLLYRAGIARDAAAALSGRSSGMVQHFYAGVRIGGRWLYLDPSCLREQKRLAAQPRSFGCLDTDYRHPFEIQPLPGSGMDRPMLMD